MLRFRDTIGYIVMPLIVTFPWHQLFCCHETKCYIAMIPIVIFLWKLLRRYDTSSYIAMTPIVTWLHGTNCFVSMSPIVTLPWQQMLWRCYGTNCYVAMTAVVVLLWHQITFFNCYGICIWMQKCRRKQTVLLRTIHLPSVVSIRDHQEKQSDLSYFNCCASFHRVIVGQCYVEIISHVNLKC